MPVGAIVFFSHRADVAGLKDVHAPGHAERRAKLRFADEEGHTIAQIAWVVGFEPQAAAAFGRSVTVPRHVRRKQGLAHPQALQADLVGLSRGHGIGGSLSQSHHHVCALHGCKGVQLVYQRDVRGNPQSASVFIDGFARALRRFQQQTEQWQLVRRQREAFQSGNCRCRKLACSVSRKLRHKERDGFGSQAIAAAKKIRVWKQRRTLFAVHGIGNKKNVFSCGAAFQRCLTHSLRMHNDCGRARKNKLFRHPERPSHPASGLAQAGGNGHLLDGSAEVIDHAGAATHAGHACGEAMGVHHVRRGLRRAVQQRFAPVAHVLPGAQQGKRPRLLLVFAGEIQLRRSRTLRSDDVRTHARRHLPFHNWQDVAGILARMEHAPCPGAASRRQRLSLQTVRVEAGTHGSKKLLFSPSYSTRNNRSRGCVLHAWRHKALRRQTRSGRA